MKPTFLLVLCACAVFSCGLIKKTAATQRFIPSIGTVGKERKTLLDKNFEQIGKPHLPQKIALSVREIQFNKSGFNVYKDYKDAKGETLEVNFVDSLPVKPKYLCLEIADKIALRSQLNHEDNADIRAYLSNDSDYRIVSQIMLVADGQNTEKLLKAEGVFLCASRDGLLHVELKTGNQHTMLNASYWEVFDYKLSGFCWGLDRYGREQIVAIPNEGQDCPKETERNPQKLDRTKSYLKL